MSPTNPVALLGGALGTSLGALTKTAAGGGAFLQALVGGKEQTAAPAESVADKQQRQQLRLEDFARQLREQLRAAGIELQTPLELELQPSGSIGVVGEHPELRRVEAVLNATPGPAAELAAILAEHAGSSSATAFDRTLSLSKDHASISSR